MRVFNTLKWAAMPLVVSLTGCSILGGAVDGPPATLLAYVSMQSQDQVSVVSIIQRAPTGESIPAGSAPTNMTINPRSDREFLYVVNSNTDSVSYLNVRTRQKEVSVAAGKSPWDIAITPDGASLFVTNTGDQTVSLIDVESRQRLKNFTFPNNVNFQPHGVATHPVSSGGARKNEAYIISKGNAGDANAPKGEIVVLKGLQTDRTIPINSAVELWKAAVTPDGSRLLVTDRGRPTLWSVDLNTGAATPISLSSAGWDVVVAKNVAFVSLPDQGAVAPIDLTTNTEGSVVSATPTGSGSNQKQRQPQALAVNSSGTELWAALAGSNEIVVYPLIEGMTMASSARLVNYSYTPGQTGAPVDIVLGRGVQ